MFWRTVEGAAEFHISKFRYFLTLSNIISVPCEKMFVRCTVYTENGGRLVNSLAWYFGGPGFKSGSRTFSFPFPCFPFLLPPPFACFLPSCCARCLPGPLLVDRRGSSFPADFWTTSFGTNSRAFFGLEPPVDEVLCLGRERVCYWGMCYEVCVDWRSCLPLVFPVYLFAFCI
jgi:hypothetical protein